jgi:hypothetical protein
LLSKWTQSGPGFGFKPSSLQVKNRFKVCFQMGQLVPLRREVQSEIAAETARLAVEVQRLSQSVKESAQRVNDMPEMIDVPVPNARKPTPAAVPDAYG